MKSLILLWNKCAANYAHFCDTAIEKDISYLSQRCEDEGLSFLTITLPAYAKDFEEALDVGSISPLHFQGFRKWRCLPAFLRGFTEKIFSPDGVLLDSPDIECIRAVRQLTRIYSKLELPCTLDRDKAAFDQYLSTDRSIRMKRGMFRVTQRENFERIAALLFSSCLAPVDRKVYDQELLPVHGPGSTADSVSGNAKWRVDYWHERLERHFPYIEMVLPSHSYWETLEEVRYISVDREDPVRVITVPKTQKNPRIIAMEPTVMQYAQQGLRRELYQHIENDQLVGPFIGFTDQIPNQDLACIGSRDGSLATIDLSEASDRVLNDHVIALFSRQPHLSEAVQDCRSLTAALPDGRKISLAKFASMGSALTFPVEAMVFLTIVFLGIEEQIGHQLTKKDVRSFHGRLRIYGDDIVIPTEYVSSVTSLLHDYGHVVNSGKSFWTGKFRESCGREFYDGHDVSIVKLRHMIPSSRRDAAELAGLSAFRNLCYCAGLWKVANHCDSILGRIIPYPTVLSTASVLGRVSFLGYQGERNCPRLHRPLVRGARLTGQAPKSKLSGAPALRKVFTLGLIPESDHLERQGRPRSVRIKIGWSPPF